MSTEKIIKRIQTDAQAQQQQLLTNAETQSRLIIKEAKTQIEKEAKSLLQNGQLDSENTKKIMISKAIQEVKRDMMNAREEIIEQCFTQALEKLASLPDDQYKKLILSYLRTGTSRLGTHFSIKPSRPLDTDIAKQQGIPVQDGMQSIGGIILQSPDGKITIDNSFESILDRKKDELRIHVGKLLFPS
jgi:V/A-type H+-transporting ATPase subunit E